MPELLSLAPRPSRAKLRPFESHRGLERLAELHEERAGLDASIEVLVAELVALGVGWGDIGRALGVSRQGARQRFG